MPRIEFSLDTDVSPDDVFAAITDFTDQRPELWPNLSRKFYEVHATGENWAEATEGSDFMGGIWAKERYEWSPGEIRATVMDSNVFKSGTWEMRISPRDGGSHIDVVNRRQPKGAKGRLVTAPLALIGQRVLKKDCEKTLDILREQGKSQQAEN